MPHLVADPLVRLRDVQRPRRIGVPAQRIGEIVAGRRSISADTDLRLCKFFGLSEGFWLRGQARFDTETAKDSLATQLAKIKPWQAAA